MVSFYKRFWLGSIENEASMSEFTARPVSELAMRARKLPARRKYGPQPMRTCRLDIIIRCSFRSMMNRPWAGAGSGPVFELAPVEGVRLFVRWASHRGPTTSRALTHTRAVTYLCNESMNRPGTSSRRRTPGGRGE